MPSMPRGPGNRKNSFSLERMRKKKKHSPTHEIFILAWNFILGLNISFSIENFNPRPSFSAAREGPGMKKPFSIENFIPYWKLDFFNMASRDFIFFNPGALWVSLHHFFTLQGGSGTGTFGTYPRGPNDQKNSIFKLEMFNLDRYVFNL